MRAVGSEWHSRSQMDDGSIISVILHHFQVFKSQETEQHTGIFLQNYKQKIRNPGKRVDVSTTASTSYIFSLSTTILTTTSTERTTTICFSRNTSPRKVYYFLNIVVNQCTFIILRLSHYVYEYLVHLGAAKTADMFKNEILAHSTNGNPNLQIDLSAGHPGFLYKWFR